MGAGVSFGDAVFKEVPYGHDPASSARRPVTCFAAKSVTEGDEVSPGGCLLAVLAKREWNEAKAYEATGCFRNSLSLTL